MVNQFLNLVRSGRGLLPPIPAAAFNVNAKDAVWVDKTCHPQSLLTFTEGVRFSGKEAAVRNRTYVLATGYDMHVFDRFYQRVKNDFEMEVIRGAMRPRRDAHRPEELAEDFARRSQPVICGFNWGFGQEIPWSRGLRPQATKARLRKPASALP